MADQTTTTTPTKAATTMPDAEAKAKAAAAEAEAAAEKAKAEAEVKAQRANAPREKDGVTYYKLLRGKHVYTAKNGEVKRAVAGDFIPLTADQLEAVKDRVATGDTPVAMQDDE